jgi:hypothetical protein
LEITLGDYTGYILIEMIKAREMADEYSRVVAERYAEDEVMRHFSVPRFRLPKMELTIPILISGARFTQTVRLDFPAEEFVAFIASRADDARATVEFSRGDLLSVVPGRGQSASAATRPTPASAAITKLAQEFHRQLTANPEPLRPDTIVTRMWAQIFRTCLEEAQLLPFYRESDPKHSLLTRTTALVLDTVRRRTVVDRTAIDSLLINPETNVVKDGSSETSVFTINADLVEDAFFLRSVRDEDTKQETKIVEFD